MLREGDRKGGIVAVPIDRPTPVFRLCEESLKKDTPADTAWFLEHPGERIRVRPSTPLEIAAFQLPADSETAVFEVEPGKHIRRFQAKAKNVHRTLDSAQTNNGRTEPSHGG